MTARVYKLESRDRPRGSSPLSDFFVSGPRQLFEKLTAAYWASYKYLKHNLLDACCQGTPLLFSPYQSPFNDLFQNAHFLPRVSSLAELLQYLLLPLFKSKSDVSPLLCLKWSFSRTLFTHLLSSAFQSWGNFFYMDFLSCRIKCKGKDFPGLQGLSNFSCVSFLGTWGCTSAKLGVNKERDLGIQETWL